MKQRTYVMVDSNKYWLYDTLTNEWSYFSETSVLEGWKPFLLRTYRGNGDYRLRYDVWLNNKQVNIKEVNDPKKKRVYSSVKQAYRKMYDKDSYVKDYHMYEKSKEYVHVRKPYYVVDDISMYRCRISKSWKDQSKKRKQYM